MWSQPWLMCQGWLHLLVKAGTRERDIYITEELEGREGRAGCLSLVMVSPCLLQESSNLLHGACKKIHNPQLLITLLPQGCT